MGKRKNRDITKKRRKNARNKKTSFYQEKLGHSDHRVFARINFFSMQIKNYLQVLHGKKSLKSVKPRS